MKFDRAIAALAVLLPLVSLADELRSGSSFTVETVPALLTAKSPPKVPVRFTLEENPSTGYRWEIVRVDP